MNTHDLVLLGLGGSAGALLMLLAFILLDFRDEKRRIRADLAAISVRTKA
jgi:hypothetical protein